MPKNSRFTCTLARDELGQCKERALVTVVDAKGDRTRGCPRHAVEALSSIINGHVDWSETRVNEFEETALRISEDRSQVYQYPQEGNRA